MTESPATKEAPRSGKVAMEGGYHFYWMRTGTTYPDIYGSIECPDGRLLPNSSGWYRTTDPDKALEIAAANLKQEMKEVA